MKFPFGTIVYHVANSKVPGVAVDKSPDGSMIRVIFKQPVGFSGNPMRGEATDWYCSADLLHTTAADAHENDKFKDQKIAQEDQAFLGKLTKLAKQVAKKPGKKKKSSKG